MLRTARTVAIVADHDKFGRFAPVRVESLGEATYLITDRRPEPAILETLASLPVELLVADEETA